MLQSIISITGKPGLFKVLSQTKNGLVVESLIDGKRMPIYASDKVSALEDISIYTTEEDMPLTDVYTAFLEHTKGKEAIAHNSKPEELRAYITEVVPNYDEERVYNSDLKKLFQWFNILVSSKSIKLEKKEEKKATTKKTKKTEEKEA